jgi:hypothetical protein
MADERIVPHIDILIFCDEKEIDNKELKRDSKQSTLARNLEDFCVL